MKIEILGCSGSRWNRGNTTAFLINGNLLLDAGTATEVLTPERCSHIRDIVLTHPHLDHIYNLVFIAELAHETLDSTYNIYSTEATIDALRNNVFNDVLWLDFTKLSDNMSFNKINAPGPFEAGEYTITPVPVSHSVPTVGYLVDDGHSVLAFAADTTSTELFWEAVENRGGVKALIVEASFPNRLKPLAATSGHLTPELLETELNKFDRTGIEVYVTHIKPRHRGEVISELLELSSRIPLKILQDGMTIEI